MAIKNNKVNNKLQFIVENKLVTINYTLHKIKSKIH